VTVPLPKARLQRNHRSCPGRVKLAIGDRSTYDGGVWHFLNRRELIQRAGAWGLASVTAQRCLPAAEGQAAGAIAGEPLAEKIGLAVLADGGNAVDAAVAAALAAGIAAPNQTGVGGYGGTLMVAPADGRPPRAIDFNTAAPAAMRPDIFRPGADGKVPGLVNDRGWLACSVPGVLAGLQLALDRYGTRSFRELAQPAIALAREGIVINRNLAALLRTHASVLTQDTGSQKLYFRDGKPLAAGDTLRNPELANLLSTLAERNSVESFYRGDIARRIAAAFAQHGGLVTVQDLAEYRARDAAPLALTWGDFTILTAPLTAGGLTVLQALQALKVLEWTKLTAPAATHARIEALRLAWRDRLALLGDPEHAEVPVDRLLSEDYARQCADEIRATVMAGKPLALETQGPASQTGTINVSVVDRQGMLVALTLTHGNAFGARVTVEGLGLTLGHGMSRFEPRPGHPNSPGPGKRPLHNMCPTLVLQGGRPLLAVGARGGRKIVTALFEFLLPLIAQGKRPAEAVAAPRLHTEGDLNIVLEAGWPVAEVAACRQIGFSTTTGTSAILSAAWVDRATGQARRAMR
jgi:gamma-glutamyltranspeptidase/glutathione hydrolase